MRRYAVATAVLLALSAPAAATFNQAMTAYEQRDYDRALDEFRRLAQENNAQAQYMLGRMYESGRGVIQSYVDAHKWYNLAAARGYDAAIDARAELEKRMTAAQIADAQRQAQRWSPEAAQSAPQYRDEPQRTARRGDVQAIQRELNARGYDAGPEDGVLGPKTRGAIREYQRDAGLDVDGQPTVALEQRLAGTTATTAAPVAAADEDDDDEDRRGWRAAVRDDFRDGNYTSDPQWVVDAGEFYVDSDDLLRSSVSRGGGRPAAPQASTGGQPEDLAFAVLGAVLERAVGGQNGGQRATPTPTAETQPVAMIHLPERFANSFAMELEIGGRVDAGGIDVGPYQDQLSVGYRLVYNVDDDGAERLALVRTAGETAQLIDVYEGDVGLADGNLHRLRWTRNNGGKMLVHLDGRRLLRATDRAFRGNFDGLVLVNRGGEFGLDSVAIETPR